MADQQAFSNQLECVIQEMRCRDDNDSNPEIIGKPYETMMERTERFEVVFEKWHKHHEHNVPLKQLEFFCYSLGSPNPVPVGMGPGPINKATQVKPNDTPQSLGITGNKVHLYVRRMDQGNQ